MQTTETNIRLIGMLDSPYVRRVAVSLHLMGVSFTHEPVSVFRQYDAFAAINPVVKAPTLVTADGVTLMDSTLILEHMERLAPQERRLTSTDLAEHARAQRIIGLTLAACEKTVQIIYEFNLRPAEKQHRPWIDRVRSQLLSAYHLLEAEIGSGTPWLSGARPLQADVSTAVAWRFTQHALAGKAEGIEAKDYPGLAAFSAHAETLPAFSAFPLD